MNLKKGDKVLIQKGNDKGKSGQIDKVVTKRDSVIIAGLNKFKKHLKKTQKNPYGGIIDVSMPVKRSNVVLICPRCEKITRISYKVTDKDKFRICKKCGESVEPTK